MHTGRLMRNACWSIYVRHWPCFFYVFLCFHCSNDSKWFLLYYNTYKTKTAATVNYHARVRCNPAYHFSSISLNINGDVQGKKYMNYYHSSWLLQKGLLNSLFFPALEWQDKNQSPSQFPHLWCELAFCALADLMEAWGRSVYCSTRWFCAETCVPPFVASPVIHYTPTLPVTGDSWCTMVLKEMYFSARELVTDPFSI